tara:strand:+ start:305 stop:1405 length:1101 start_codon:yes stop_codon:yes gene_type:complete
MEFDDEDFIVDDNNDNVTHLGLSTDLSKRQGFNETGTIDLNDYTTNGVTLPDFHDADFSHFAYLDLSSVDEDDEKFWNLGIRTDNDREERIDSFTHSFKKQGFNTSFAPPCVDTDDNILEGRTRITAAKRNGEKYIPVAVYVRQDTGIRNTISNGIKANFQPFPQHPPKFKDIVSGGVKTINEKELEPEKKAVEDWLRYDIGAYDQFDNSVNGIVTKMRDAILARATQGESLIKAMTSDQAHAWIKKNLSKKKGDYVLLNAKDDETYSERAYRHIRRAVRDGNQPVDIVFYTTVYSPADARTGLNKQVEYLDKLYLDAWNVVNCHVGKLINLEPPTDRPWKFLGCIPQFDGIHKLTSTRLVKIDKY